MTNEKITLTVIISVTVERDEFGIFNEDTVELLNLRVAANRNAITAEDVMEKVTSLLRADKDCLCVCDGDDIFRYAAFHTGVSYK